MNPSNEAGTLVPPGTPTGCVFDGNIVRFTPGFTRGYPPVTPTGWDATSVSHNLRPGCSPPETKSGRICRLTEILLRCGIYTQKRFKQEILCVPAHQGPGVGGLCAFVAPCCVRRSFSAGGFKKRFEPCPIKPILEFPHFRIPEFPYRNFTRTPKNPLRPWLGAYTYVGSKVRA